MKKKPKTMPAMLKLWTPEAEGSARLLYFLSRELSPDWWRGKEDRLKIRILHEMKRIDDGRGIINNWLASIVHEENRTAVLKVINSWNWTENPYPAVLLKAWRDKINNEQSKPSVRRMALEIITGAGLSPEKFPMEKPPENDEPVGLGGDREEKQKTILKYLTGGEKRTVEELSAVTNAVIKTGTAPGIYGADVLNALLYQWDANMRECMQVIPEEKSGWLSSNRNLWTLRAHLDAQKAVRERIWKGAIGVASYFPAAVNIIQSWVEYWLPWETSLEILNLVADWQPEDESAQKRLIELWKPYLFPQKERPPSVSAVCEKIQWAAWRFMWRTVSRKKNSNREWEESGNDCLDIMHLFLKTVQTCEDRTQYLHEILTIIGMPERLAPQQQVVWNNLWMEWLQSSNGQVVEAAVIHLSRLATEGLISPEEVRGAVFKRLTSATPLETGIVRHLLQGIGPDKNMESKILETGWNALHQSEGWNYPEIRLTAVKALTEHLDKIWFDGKENTSLSGLTEFYLNILWNDPDPEVIFHLGEQEFFWWGWKEKFNPDRVSGRLPDFFRKSGAVWIKRLHDPQPEIRKTAWEVLNQRGEIPGADLIECLSRERSWDGLYVMSEWVLPRGESFPPGFWEGWQMSLLELSGTMRMGREKGMLIRKPGEIRHVKFNHVPESIFIIAEKISRTFIAATFSGEFSGEGEKNPRQENDLNGMKTFWEKLIAGLPEQDGIYAAKRQDRILGAILALDSAPEVFQTRWSELDGIERQALVGRLDGLLKSFSGSALTKKRQKEPDRNVMYNLATVMEERMDDKNAMESETFRKTMVGLWNCGTWPPEQMPPGWTRFCEILEKETNPERFVRLIQMGREVKDFRCRRILRQMMESMRQSGESLRATLAEYVICCDLAVECENLGRYVPQGRTSDEVTEWLWLRQVVHRHPDLFSGARVLLKKGGEGSGEKMNPRQGITLANHLAGCIYPKALRDGYRKTAKSGIKEKTSFFCDRQEIGIMSPQPERSTGENPQRGQMGPIIRLAG